MKNFLEYGSRTQSDLLQPFLAQLNAADIWAADFPEFFEQRILAALSVRSERENVPAFIVDEEDYIRKSEIMLAMSLFKVALNKMVGSSDTEDPFAFGEPSHTHENAMELSRQLWQIMLRTGQERHWDGEILRLQLGKMLKIMRGADNILDLYLPRLLTGLDYN